MAITLTVNENTWVTLAEANEYLEERLAADAYNDATDETKKRSLITAYRTINYLGDYTINTSNSIDDVIKYAQCEQALFLLNFKDDYDKRMGLQSQGVTKAGIVEEEYDESSLGKTGLSPAVKEMLESYATGAGIYFVELTRDEGEDV